MSRVVYSWDMTSLAELRSSSLASLEEMYRAAPMGPPPRGRMRGHVLARVESRLAKSLKGALILAPFARAPFGVDFTNATWFFVRPWLRMGRFRTELGRSRWRDADVLRLEYDVSRLPRPVRNFLYDEVKPLGDALCLGLGGINAPRGDGDLFFFALESSREAAPRTCARAPRKSTLDQGAVLKK